jgi:hypothetical protein
VEVVAFEEEHGLDPDRARPDELDEVDPLG